MKDWMPKVGDLVTPDPDTDLGNGLKEEIGSIFQVVEVYSDSFALDRIVGGLTDSGWRYEYWMPAKNATVFQIIKDL